MTSGELLRHPEKHLLASRPTPPEVVVNAIRSSAQNGAPVLDIGAGDGRLVRTVKEYLSASPVYTLDRDINALRLPNRQSEGSNRVAGDAFRLPFRNRSFGLALSVNVAHEVCGAQTEKERREKFQKFVSEVKTTLKPGGEFIIYDGTMPENNDEIIGLHPRSPESLQKFHEFAGSYEGKELSAQQIAEDQFQLPMGDLVCFLTSYLI